MTDSYASRAITMSKRVSTNIEILGKGFKTGYGQWNLSYWTLTLPRWTPSRPTDGYKVTHCANMRGRRSR